MLALGASAAAALGGCGQDDPAVAARARTLSLTLDEYRVSPQRTSARAGRLRIVARNTGVLTHNIAVVQYRRPIGTQEERRYARSETAQPGESVETNVTLRAGKYRLICTIANHDNLGQYGELVVK